MNLDDRNANGFYAGPEAAARGIATLSEALDARNYSPGQSVAIPAGSSARLSARDQGTSRDTTSTHSGDTPPAYVNPPEYFDPPAANSNPPKYSTLAEPECLSIAPPPSAAAQSNFNTQVLPLPVPIIIPDLVVVPIAQIMVRDEGEAEQGIAPRSSPIRYRPRLRLRKFSSVCCFWTILIILLALVFGIGMVTVACAAGHCKTAEQVQMHYE